MKKLILSLLSAGAVFASAHAFADIIISDDYAYGPGDTNTGSNETGRTPDIADLPGTTWTQADNSWSPSFDVGNAFILYTDASDEISLGSYATSPILSISSSVLVNTTQDGGGSDVYYRGIGLGFFSSLYATGGHGNSGFTGLMLNPNGSLSLDINGNYTGVSSVWDTAASGAYSNSDTLTLSYSIDTANGTISNVLLGGHDYSSYFSGTYAGLETPGLTDYAGGGVSAANGGATSYFGITFVVSTPTVPEPATNALLALGGFLALAGWLRFRRGKA